MSKPEITNEMMARLPKWAQEEISILHMRISDFKRALTALGENHPSSISYGQWSAIGETFIPDNETITFQMGGDPKLQYMHKIEVTRKREILSPKDEAEQNPPTFYLEVRSARIIQIEPRAANTIIVRVSEW